LPNPPPTTGRADESGQHANGGRLAGTIGTYEATSRSTRDGEAEIIDDLAITDCLVRPVLTTGSEGELIVVMEAR
jgi:hypothetical protein